MKVLVLISRPLQQSGQSKAQAECGDGPARAVRGAKHREKEATHSAMNHRAQNPVILIMYVWCIAVPLCVDGVRCGA